MSDQDFFFDEEDEKTPAKADRASGSKSGASRASGTKSTASKADTKPQAAPAATSGGGSFFDQTVTMAVAALLVVCALLIGAIVGLMVGQSRANSTANLPAASGTAPQLTPDQLNSGQLPAGHPSIGGATTTTGSTAATK